MEPTHCTRWKNQTTSLYIIVFSQQGTPPCGEEIIITYLHKIMERLTLQQMLDRMDYYIGGVNTSWTTSGKLLDINDANEYLLAFVRSHQDVSFPQDYNDAGIGKIVLTKGQKEYKIAEGVTNVIGVYVETKNTTRIFDNVNPMDGVFSNNVTVGAIPTRYTIFGDYIRFDVELDEDVTILVQKSAGNYSSDDLTKKNGFLADFMQALPIVASRMFAQRKSLQVLTSLQSRELDLLSLIKSKVERRHTATTSKATFPKLKKGV